jgi:hypothetical protein
MHDRLHVKEVRKNTGSFILKRFLTSTICGLDNLLSSVFCSASTANVISARSGAGGSSLSLAKLPNCLSPS